MLHLKVTDVAFPVPACTKFIKSVVIIQIQNSKYSEITQDIEGVLENFGRGPIGFLKIINATIGKVFSLDAAFT